jgi:hypothetical protein
MNIDDDDDDNINNNNKFKSVNNNNNNDNDDNIHNCTLDNDENNGVQLSDIHNNNDTSIIDDNDIFLTDDNNNNNENNNINDNNKDKFKIQRNVGNIILMLLFLVGIIAGIVNGYTLFIIKNLLKVQSLILMSNVVGVIPFMIVAAIFCGISAYITKIAQVPAAVGSGIPELKALLSSDFHSSEYPALLSLKIEFSRLLSLIFAMGSGLAIGR